MRTAVALRISWASLLNRIANQANRARKTIFGQHALDLDYYWSVAESEWASDILFRSAADLCPPAQWEGRRVRALNPFSVEDAALLAAVNPLAGNRRRETCASRWAR
ncbi:MAG TPA: hypothetical protein VF278_20680 [Pirellulales bacterium]